MKAIKVNKIGVIVPYRQNTHFTKIWSEFCSLFDNCMKLDSINKTFVTEYLVSKPTAPLSMCSIYMYSSATVLSDQIKGSD